SRWSRSHSDSTVRRSTSKACAKTEAVSGSSETKNNASRARVSCTFASSVIDPSSRPRDLDVAERLGLRQIHLAFTVQLEDRQEAHHDVDPFLAVGHQISEGGTAAE